MEQSLLVAARTGGPPLPSEDIAQLQAILAMVDELAGEQVAKRLDVDLTAIDAAHAAAPGLVRARYARLASRTASFSAAGVSALISAPASGSAQRSAAAYLAGEMRHAIGAMAAALR